MPYLLIITVLLGGAAGEPGVAGDLLALLGLPAGVQSVLGAPGVRHRPGHHDDRRPRLLPGRLLGEQTQVFRRRPR